MSEPAKVHPISGGNGTATSTTTQPTAVDKPARTRAKPNYSLPTQRLTCENQFNLLRAYAAVSGPSKKPVKIDEVVEVSKLGNTTISLANAFLVEAGLLLKTDAGFMPSESVRAFALAYEWGPDTAAQKLAPTIRSTWFAERVIPKLSMGRVPEKELFDDLAMASAVGPEFKPRIKLLIDFLVETGIAEREGDFLKKGSMLAATAAVVAPVSDRAASATPDEVKEVVPRDGQRDGQRSSVNSAFTQMTGGAVQFNISVKVDMAEFENWQPELVTAFFGGIAAVLSAKAAVEKAAGKKE
ncbi:MAG TPA: hypothetical protein VGD61_27720 [Pyrinomonadaceae bacterium]